MQANGYGTYNPSTNSYGSNGYNTNLTEFTYNELSGLTGTSYVNYRLPERNLEESDASYKCRAEWEGCFRCSEPMHLVMRSIFPVASIFLGAFSIGMYQTITDDSDYNCFDTDPCYQMAIAGLVTGIVSCAFCCSCVFKKTFCDEKVVDHYNPIYQVTSVLSVVGTIVNAIALSKTYCRQG